MYYNGQRQQCPQGTFTYTIKAGDSFYRLGIKFNTTIAALKSANPSANPNNLQIGECICVPRQQIYSACPEDPQDTPDMLPPMKELPVFVEGVTDYRQAKLYRSEQEYLIYVLDKYQFTAEEPGSDVIFSTFDDSFFVRIQRLPLDVNISDVRQNAVFGFTHIGEPRELRGEEILDPFFRSNKFFFIASNVEVTLISILKEIDGGLFRFTMFSPNSEAAEGIIPSFYVMMKTITVM